MCRCKHGCNKKLRTKTTNNTFRPVFLNFFYFFFVENGSGKKSNICKKFVKMRMCFEMSHVNDCINLTEVTVLKIETLVSG